MNVEPVYCLALWTDVIVLDIRLIVCGHKTVIDYIIMLYTSNE